MRIVGGKARGRPLRAPRGHGTRPTADRVREALFSIVEARLDLSGAAVLDLYAGSGALGLEALSRGAGSLVAVDRGAPCWRVIIDNAERLGFSSCCTVLRAPVLEALDRLARGGARFRLVVADPPYEDDPAPALARLATRDLVETGGLVVIEHGRTRRLDQRCGRLSLLLRRVHGDNALSVYGAGAEDTNADVGPCGEHQEAL